MNVLYIIENSIKKTFVCHCLSKLMKASMGFIVDHVSWIMDLESWIMDLGSWILDHLGSSWMYDEKLEWYKTHIFRGIDRLDKGVSS